ncbi:MAG: putative Ig domain-containing protein, partial [Burkholderiales bacterium]
MVSDSEDSGDLKSKFALSYGEQSFALNVESNGLLFEPVLNELFAPIGSEPIVNTSTITTITDLTASHTGNTDPTQSPSSDTSTLYNTGTAWITGIGDVNTASGNYAYANDILANFLRPGSLSLADQILASQLAQSIRANPDLANSLVYRPEILAAAINLLGTGVQNAIPTDPLVLDLNGDGVRLASFGEAPVLFDVDHDGGTKEITGWVTANTITAGTIPTINTDGIVSYDLNGDGVINDISETLSEYFNGTVGTNGEAGTKPYADGFAALKSLDSNADNQFTSADAAWSNVKVWVDDNADGISYKDVNGDGQYEAGIDTTELMSLDELGITSINLAPTTQSGLVNGGNEVLATGTFVQNGITQEAQAARFIANPTGNTATVGATGTTVSAEDGQSTYVSSLTTGEVIDVSVKGVKNAYGNSGDDTLTGDADANWLVGGQGSDTFDAGAGDDMLIIDAADLQANIHAGDGFDMVQVVGTEGVTLNLAQAEVEVVAGGTGDDIFIGGGRSSVFIRANDGDDIVIGGAANDALSGENGNDLIDGGAGNDVIRGGRGQDQLMGGAGDDLVFGGQDDDRISGGSGNDVLRGEQGDDSIDGGDGIDIAEFSGSFADYRVTKLSDTSWRVVDTKSGRDGADMLTNVEKLNFADISAVDLGIDRALPVRDALTVDSHTGTKAITVAELLANDQHWGAEAISVRAVASATGGEIVGATTAAGLSLKTRAMTDGSFTFWEYDQAGFDAKKAVIDADWDAAVNTYDSTIAEQATAVTEFYAQNGILTAAQATFATAQAPWSAAQTTFAPAQTAWNTALYTFTTVETNWNDAASAWNNYWDQNGNGVVEADDAGLGYAQAKLNWDYFYHERSGSFSLSNASAANGYNGFVSDGKTNQGWGHAFEAVIPARANYLANPNAANTNAYIATLQTCWAERAFYGLSGYADDQYAIIDGNWNVFKPDYDSRVAAWNAQAGNAGTFTANVQATVTAQDAYNDAVTPYNNAVSAYDDALAIYTTAQETYNDAVTSWNATLADWETYLYGADRQDDGIGGFSGRGDFQWLDSEHTQFRLVAPDYPDSAPFDQRLATALAESWLTQHTLDGNDQILFAAGDGQDVMTFKYYIQDAAGNGAATAFLPGTDEQAEMAGQVVLKIPGMPDDPLFAQQWYLNDINVAPVWQDAYGEGYTGKGVRIAQFEPGMPFSTGTEVFDYRHPDLQPNVDPGWISDPDNGIPQSFSQHATLVAGVMVAARNGEGAVGVAYDAKLSGHYIQGTGLEVAAMNQEIINALAQFKNYDVVNNSWGSTANFDLNVTPVGAIEQGMLDAITQGRNGLGTAIVMAGGNERANGGNTNYNALTANRAVIVTGAINAQADLSTLTIGQAPFSNPGASILISAPGSNIASTSQILMGDDGTIFGSDTATTEGTSFATPIVSGVVALMLEANPNLGWRDIQQILAITARKVNDPNTDTVWNGAGNWNGGGMHTSHDYGFGDVDARAAVRLAEIWQGTHVSGNERHLASGEGSVNGGADLGIAIGDGAVISRTLAIGAGLRAEHATVSLDITHSNWGDLTVELISPTGTISELIANPGSSAANPAGDVGSGQLVFALDTTHDYGENAEGDWQLRITDRSGGGTGTLNGWKVDVYGSDINETNTSLGTVGEIPVISATGNDIYYYTDEFAAAPGAARATLTDTNGGIDTINAAAVLTGSVINLNNGANSIIAGRSLTVNGDVEFAFGGDGNDTLTGNALSNRLLGGRGNDAIVAGDGNDIIDGGQGDDTLTGGNGYDYFVLRTNSGTDTITDFAPGVDRLLLVGMDSVTPSFAQTGADTLVTLDNGRSLLLNNVAASSLSESSVLHVEEDAVRYLRDTFIFGSDGDDTIFGGSDGDRIYGGAGNDLLVGDLSNTGPGGGDYIDGGAGDDEVIGGAGGDTLIGGAGQDYVQGDAGNDVIYLEGDSFLYTNAYSSNAAVRGNGGADTFVLTQTTANSDIASNFIWDFELGQVGSPMDRIDLSTITEATDLSRLVIVDGNLTLGDGNPIAEVSIAGDALGRTVTLYGIAAGELRAEHFIFATAQATSNGVITGTTAADILTGDAGGNILDGGAGADAMTGRTGDDSYIVDNVGDTVYELPGGGFDTVKSSVSYALPANVENLVLTGTADIDGTGNDAANRITGNSGNNTLDGGAGVDALLGGAGDDIYIVDNQSDTITEDAGEGTDTVQASVSFALGDNLENLTLTGTAAANATGNALANALTGNAADNILDGAAGADTMAGGAGDDTYFVDNAGDVVTELADEGIDTVYAGVDFTLADGAGNGANVENVVLYGAATTATGNSLDNQLVGNALNNTLGGGAGSDFLDGGAGADSMTGGAGDDIYVVDDAGDVVTESADQGIDTVQASVSFDLTSRPNVENVILTGTSDLNATGNGADNTLIGNAGANVLAGAAGNDFLDGGAGIDQMSGGMGNDTYIVDNAGDTVTENSAEGTDTVIASVSYSLASLGDVENITLSGFADIDATGNSLANTLTGNSGDNLLSGGAGNDVYVFNAGFGLDTVVDSDASAGNVDIIRFGSGIAPAEVTAARDGQDLMLTRGSDSVTVQNWYASDADKVEQVEFADSTMWNAAQLRAMTNLAPVVANGIAAQAAIEDAAFSYQIPTDVFTDADAEIGDTLLLSAALANGDALPAWISFDAATRTFSGTSANADVGTLSLKVTATDGGSLSVSDTFDVSVANTNDAPTVANAIADQAATEDAVFSFTVPGNAFADVDAGDTLAYTASLANGDPLPGWLSFDAATRTFSGTPLNADVGTLSLKVTATDGGSLSVSDTFEVTVANTNDAPTDIGLSANTVAENAANASVGTLSTNDVDVGDTFTYSILEGGDGAQFAISGHTLKVGSTGLD